MTHFQIKIPSGLNPSRIRIVIKTQTNFSHLPSGPYNFHINKLPIISLPVTKVVLHSVGKSSVEKNVSA